MATSLDIIAQEDPIYAANIKKYEEAELSTLTSYIEQTITWMQSKNYHLDTCEDVVAIRIGVPYLGSDLSVDATTVYTSNDDIDRLIASIGLDFLSFTTKNPDESLRDTDRLTAYTYKSEYIHRIFGMYFVDGVDNRTGYLYLDEYDIVLSRLSSMLVEYDEVLQHHQFPEEVPLYVIDCMRYVVQNPKLVVKLYDTIRENQGDIIYYSAKGFFNALVSIKYKAEHKFPEVSTAELPLAREKAIEKILDVTGTASSFDDLSYGGTIENLTALIRIPASRANQLQLQGLLGTEDFNDVFKEVWVWKGLGDTSNDMPKDDDYNDPYSDEIGEEYIVGGTPLLDDVSGGYYGCKGGTQYTDEEMAAEAEARDSAYDGDIIQYEPLINTDANRHWMVSDEWLASTTPEKVAIVFWMGFDMSMKQDTNPCPYDEIATIAIVIAVAVFTANPEAGFTVGNVLIAATAVVSIATTVGAIDQKTGTYLAVALAVASLGASWEANSVAIANGTQATVQFAIQIGNTALAGLEAYDAYKDYAGEAEDNNKRADELHEEAEMYESNLRIKLSGTDYSDFYPTFDQKVRDSYASLTPYEYNGTAWE